MPLTDLFVLFAIFALTGASAILLRRQGIRGRDLLVAIWLCFYGLVLIAMMTAHSGEILYRTVAARAALPPGVSSYNFRLYSLLLLGFLLIAAGAMCLRVASSVGRGSIEGRRTAIRTSVFVLGIVAPLIPLQMVFGILLTVLSVLSLLVLRRRSHIEGSRRTVA